MLDNHLYNLMIQLVEENKSLWRIKDDYMKDAGNNSEQMAFWKKMEADKEAHVEELLSLVKKHLQ
jgi:hypothetical protein